MLLKYKFRLSRNVSVRVFKSFIFVEKTGMKENVRRRTQAGVEISVR
jgi:hypothetical protein